jgi:molybdenum cofactor cytidylyltransferase
VSNPRIAIVILAAGTSSRLGRPKQLLPLGGEPLLRHSIRNAQASRADEVLLVLGSRAAEIQAAVGELGHRTVVNPAFADGQSTSMVAGIDALDGNVQAAIMMLGDQPTVSTATLNALIERFKRSPSAIVQASYDFKPGNPVLFDRSMFPALLAVTGDRGARDVIKQHRDALVLVEMEQSAPPDVDSDEDYAVLKKLWNNR